jgi:hypothetical protein
MASVCHFAWLSSGYLICKPTDVWGFAWGKSGGCHWSVFPQYPWFIFYIYILSFASPLVFLSETRFISTAGFLKRMHFSDKSRDAVYRRAHVQMAACLLRNRFNLAFKIQMCIAVQMRFAACAETVQIPALAFLSTAGVGHSCRRTHNCLHVVANWAFWWRYGWITSINSPVVLHHQHVQITRDNLSHNSSHCSYSTSERISADS